MKTSVRLFAFLAMIIFATACSSTKKRKKKCSTCPSWSQIEVQELHQDQAYQLATVLENE